MTADRRWFVVSCTMVAFAIGILDLVTGSEISVALLYLVPIAAATWFAGRYAGMFLCLVSVVLRVTDIWFTTHHFSHPVTPYWNAGIELGCFVFTASVLSRLRSAMAREATLARTDTLTGLLNRRAFWELATRELARAERHGRPLSLAYLDIDDFKQINDQGGHDVGDAILARIATTLQSNVRSVDVVARVGGDEFLVLLPETGAEATTHIVRKLVESLRSVTRDAGWPATMSVGVVTIETPQISVDQLVCRADALAYAAKRDGKNRVRQIELDRDEIDRALPRSKRPSYSASPESPSSLPSPFLDSRAVSR